MNESKDETTQQNGTTVDLLQVDENMDESLMIVDDNMRGNNSDCESLTDDDDDGDDDDDDDDDEDGDDETSGDDGDNVYDNNDNNDPSKTETSVNLKANQLKKSQKSKSKKRKKSSNQRRNIRKVFRSEQLDAKTLEAQEQEKERLKRIERQRHMQCSEQGTSHVTNEIVENDFENPNYSSLDNSIIIVDDENDSDYSEEEAYNRENIILISSTDSEQDSDTDGDNDNDHLVHSDQLNDSRLKNDKGKVIINPNHPPDEPDIFLPARISNVIKPHQISGVRFLYDNLIESLKNYKSNEGFGCVLAHSMGLGKTIQTIALVHVFLKYTPARKVLIIVPINTLQNWLSEFNTWLPETCTAASKEDVKNNMEPGTSECSVEKVVDNESQTKEDNKTEEENTAVAREETKIDVNMAAVTENDKNVSGVLNDSGTNIDNSTNENSSPRIDIDKRDYKVFLIGDNQKTTISRAKVIGEWHNDGGVLLIGYEMFRGISLYTPSLCNSVTNAKGKKKKQKAKKITAVIDIEEEEREMQLLMGMQKALCKPGPDLVVCDEGHRIKNHQSNIHMALHMIKTRKRLVLTGYPLQNNLTEYWCMVDFVRPSYLGTRQEFQNMFERPITNGQCIDSTAADKKFMKYRAHVLSSLLKGFVQRRGYSALKHALPPKQEHVIMVRLSNIQQAVYRRFIDLMQEGFGDQLNPIKIFAVCSKIWNHPDILYKAMKADESKHVDLFDTDEDVGPDDKPKTKIPKNNSKPNQNSANSLSEEGFNPFGGGEEARSLLLKITDWAKEIFDSHSYKEGLIETSGKFVLLLEIIRESLARDDKILVFSQSLMSLDLIEEVLHRTPIFNNENHSEMTTRKWKKNIDYYRIDGSTPAVEREKLIDSFNNKENKDTKLFMLSTRAGCLGINLVAANRVVVFDVSWNPCHDAQAVCRVYRYGQEKPCYIYRLVASNTMEKRMYYRQISKQGVSDRVIDELNPIENFTKEEVTKLLSTTWEDEPEIDYTEDIEKFDDPVLKEICRKCGKLIVMTPFKHESLLEDHEPSKLSRADKKQAKRAYEEEKQRSRILFNGSASMRAPYTFQRPMGQVLPSLNSSYATPVPNSTLYGHHALYGQNAIYGNQLLQSQSDIQRLQSIIAHRAAMTMKDRERNANNTPSQTHPQASTAANVTSNNIADVIQTQQNYNVSSASTSISPHHLATMSAFQTGMYGPLLAPVHSNIAIQRNTSVSIYDQSNNIQGGSQHVPSATSSAQEDLSNLSNDSISRQTSESSQIRQSTEVICLDTDDED